MAPKTQPLTEEDQAALEKRGINPDQAHLLTWQSCDRKGWIAIPFLRRGKQVNTKYRRIVKAPDGNNFEQDKGGEQCFYNLEALEALECLSPDDLRATTVIVTEGEMDCAVALQCGYTAVSVPSGAPGKPVGDEDSAKFDFVKDFPKYVIAVLAVDDDPAGHALRHDLATRFGWYRCKWVQYPRGCKDLNDTFVKYGRAGVDKVLGEKARFMNSGGLFRMGDIPAQPPRRAYECGIGSLSTMIKLRLGDLSVITGLAGIGKTSFINALACNMVRLYGWQVCMGSFETNPRDDHLRLLRTFHIGRAPETWIDAEIAEADRWIETNFSFIVPDPDSLEMTNLKWVLERARAAITQYGANHIIVDPWNQLDHDRPQGMSGTEYIAIALKEFKRLAKQYLVHVTVVAHPSKPEKNKFGGYDAPSLYDISDSAHWRNACDIGIVVHRVAGEKEGSWATEIHVDKVRQWGIIGREGVRMLEYLPERAAYMDASDFIKKGAKKEKPIIESETKMKAGSRAQSSLPYKE